ncbi:recombinase RecT [Mycobacterium sp. MYCO198283]|uniref:recombinase RecT n=1 Tax=Mycobacterium sp. MYCO198283 TaxID=2883505 RepID=UPI001E3045BF|nr:recombinase RecT [Mycobacterium sp. MYCO198283]MCG5431199.1 recombinase RecT [Mycobacterium sp. MYCO198283]
MTETRTATSETQDWRDLGANARGNLPQPHASSKLALRAGQDDWTEDQRVQLRALGLEHATEADLRLLYHYTARTGLDPFTKQVYMVSRRTKIKVRVQNPDTGNERIEERDVDKFTVQVGIDGWRVIGTRAARREGVRVGHDDVLWRGKGTGWIDYWDKDEHGGPPSACKYTVEFDGVRVSATCSYAEYVQLTRINNEWVPNSMWSKMPANQLAKCAEALAWRKAFPADYSGLVLEDAAQAHEIVDGEVIDTAATPAGSPQSAPPRKAAGASRNAQRAARAQQKQADGVRALLITELDDILKRGGVDKFADAALIVAQLGGLQQAPSTPDDVTDETLRGVVGSLRKLAAADRPLNEALDDVFNTWLLAHPDEPTPTN